MEKKYWLLAIAAGCVSLHVTLTHRLGNQSFLALSCLVWCAVSSLIWQKRDRLLLKSKYLPTVLGCLLLAGLLSYSFASPAPFVLEIYPFVAALGLGLIASGFRHLHQFRCELIMLFFLGVPRAVINPIADVSLLTAKLSTAILWYFGQGVFRQGTVIALPEGAVNVNKYCSGQEGMFDLLSLSILALLMYPICRRKSWFVPLVAVVVAFVINSFRVVLMTLLINAQKRTDFDYWHEGNGSLIFSLISVTLFGLFYWLLLKQEPIAESLSEESELVQ